MTTEIEAAIAALPETETLRDKMAMAALSGLVVGCAGMLGDSFSAYANGPCNKVLAERSFALADAMLAARQKGGA